MGNEADENKQYNYFHFELKRRQITPSEQVYTEFIGTHLILINY